MRETNEWTSKKVKSQSSLHQTGITVRETTPLQIFRIRSTHLRFSNSCHRSNCLSSGGTQRSHASSRSPCSCARKKKQEAWSTLKIWCLSTKTITSWLGVSTQMIPPSLATSLKCPKRRHWTLKTFNLRACRRTSKSRNCTLDPQRASSKRSETLRHSLKVTFLQRMKIMMKTTMSSLSRLSASTRCCHKSTT